jgi:hypothetical protein
MTGPSIDDGAVLTHNRVAALGEPYPTRSAIAEFLRDAVRPGVRRNLEVAISREWFERLFCH